MRLFEVAPCWLTSGRLEPLRTLDFGYRELHYLSYWKTRVILSFNMNGVSIRGFNRMGSNRVLTGSEFNAPVVLKPTYLPRSTERREREYFVRRTSDNVGALDPFFTSLYQNPTIISASLTLWLSGGLDLTKASSVKLQPQTSGSSTPTRSVLVSQITDREVRDCSDPFTSTSSPSKTP